MDTLAINADLWRMPVHKKGNMGHRCCATLCGFKKKSSLSLCLIQVYSVRAFLILIANKYTFKSLSLSAKVMHSLWDTVHTKHTLFFFDHFFLLVSHAHIAPDQRWFIQYRCSWYSIYKGTILNYSTHQCCERYCFFSFLYNTQRSNRKYLKQQSFINKITKK